MALEQQIEELRAELSACSDDAERAQIVVESELAKAELAAQEQAA